MEPDLSRLLAELNLPPDCTLEQFQRALRRRIGELHPDRAGANADSPADQAALHRLLATYSAVTRFHRRYGRMPGALVVGQTGDVRATMVHPALQLPLAPPTHDQDTPEVPTARILLLLVTLVLLLASWDWLVLHSSS